MAIIPRGHNTYLIRVYLGHDPINGKRLEINETVHGTPLEAERRETVLKAEKHSGKLNKSSRITINELLDIYLNASRHRQTNVTRHKLLKEWRLFVSPYIGSVQIAKIKTSDFQQLFNHLLDRKKETNDDEK